MKTPPSSSAPHFHLRSGSGAELGTLAPGQTVDRELLDRAGNILTIKGFAPFVDAAGCWHPDMKRLPPLELPWTVEFTCGANRSFPFWALHGQDYRNCLAVGLTDCLDDCRVQAKMNQEAGGYELTFTLAIDPATEPFQLWLDECRRPLSETIAAFRRLLLPVPPVYPDQAWQPVYCTWYAVHTALSADYLDENARLARQLGCGTFIVDDGWCLNENKRVTPETLRCWYRDIGDWEPAERKLPQLAQSVSRAQAEGWNYLFWVAPFFVGDRSRLARQTNSYLDQSFEGRRLFDPADAVTAQLTMEKITDFFRRIRPDGLKIDFLDSITPDEKRPRSRAAFAYIQELVHRIRTLRPDALIEFRQHYATPVTAGLATAFRAGDVPFDYIENFQRCVQLRLLLGDGVPIQADPVYFRRDETPVNVARHMMAAMAGVPMLSLELRTLSAMHRRIVANYLALYHRRRSILNFGRWEFHFRFGHAVWARCCGEHGMVLFLWAVEYLTGALTGAPAAVTVLNLSSDPLACPGMAAFDPAGEPAGSTAPPGGRLETTAREIISGTPVRN